MLVWASKVASTGRQVIALADPPLTMVALDADVTARYIVAVVTAFVAERTPPDPPATAGASIVDRGSV